MSHQIERNSRSDDSDTESRNQICKEPSMGREEQEHSNLGESSHANKALNVSQEEFVRNFIPIGAKRDKRLSNTVETTSVLNLDEIDVSKKIKTEIIDMFSE